MDDTEQTIFGLLSTAQEHQNLIADAIKALEQEKAHLQLERQALKRAVAALEAATQGIPSLIQKNVNEALSGAVSATSEEMKGVFIKTGSVLRGDLERVRVAAQETVKAMNEATGTYFWKCAAAGVAGGFVVLVLGLTARALGLF